MRKLVADLILAMTALLPLYTVYAAHYSQTGQATGFVQYDMPYYVANGREVFERGNGFAAPNPYDPDSGAPVIYFHWLTWLIGTAVIKLGTDPGTVFVMTGLLGGLIGSFLTLRIIRYLAGDQPAVVPVFLLAMWGGGVFFVARLMMNLIQGSPLLDSPLRFDPGGGWWFLTWGRNFLLPTEAVYHAFVAGIWLAVFKQREWLAVLLIGLLAATHPFSGIQHLLILGVWNLVQLFMKDARRPIEHQKSPVESWRAPLFRGLTLTGILAVFLGYYFVYLEQFPSHSELRETWSLKWNVPGIIVILGYGPVMFLALRRVLHLERPWRRDVLFLCVAFVVSLLLIQHDLFIKPHQPLHFTRGYVWFPLFLIGVPIVADFIGRFQSSSHRLSGRVKIALLILVASLDNLAFLTSTVVQNRNELRLPKDARDAFSWMSENDFDGVLLTPDPTLSYLSATYSAARPYYGHKFNTPHFQTRVENVDLWAAGGELGADFAAVDYLLLEREQRQRRAPIAGWTIVYENATYALWTRDYGSESLPDETSGLRPLTDSAGPN